MSTSAERVAARYLNVFSVGERVVVKNTHGAPSFRGLTGVIQKKVSFNKAYVVLDERSREAIGEDRIFVDLDDLERQRH